MEEVTWERSCEILCNGDFISIRSYSGDGLYMVDPEAEEYLLKPDVSDQILGECVLKSLDQSRFLEDSKFLEINSKCDENYKVWIEKMKGLYGYKTKKALFRKMKNCWVELADSAIMIEPSYHEKLEGWSGLDDDLTVKIPVTSSPEEIGAAVRLAFSRCTSRTF